MKHLRQADSDISVDDQIESQRISRVLGGLPVAIAHVAGYIHKSHVSLSEFSAIYKKRDQSWRIWSQNCRAWNYQYDRSLNTVWEIALTELTPAAREMVNILSMLSPDNIPESILFANDQDGTGSFRETQ